MEEERPFRPAGEPNEAELMIVGRDYNVRYWGGNAPGRCRTARLLKRKANGVYWMFCPGADPEKRSYTPGLIGKVS